MEKVEQRVLVQLAHRDRRPVHGAPVEGEPFAVERAAHAVGERDVRVQVRVAVAGLEVVVRDRDHPAHARRSDARAARAGGRDLGLEPVERAGDRVAVRAHDRRLRVAVGDAPDDAHRLGDAERQVEP
nr:hypothetical protein [Isoptericola sp. BMS4]